MKRKLVESNSKSFGNKMVAKLKSMGRLLRSSAFICDRTYAGKLKGGLLPATYETRVAGQGISTRTAVLPAEKRLKL